MEPGLNVRVARARRKLFKGNAAVVDVAEQRTFEVFAREDEEELRRVGSVNASSASLAETYARALYAEDANWAEMAVVPREEVSRIANPRPG